MRARSRDRMMLGMLMVISGTSFPASRSATEQLILPPSIELERKTQPWCPGDCTLAVPFVADYRKENERLVFVGVRHAFEPGHPTMRAIAFAFDAVQPGVVILEGFPLRMGENPPQLVELAKNYGSPHGPDFARGEASYAASLALARHIPFIGGEPTHAEQLEALKLKGFTEQEVTFGSLLGWFSQARRSGDMPDTSPESLEKSYPSLAQNVAAQWRLGAPTLAAFRQRYSDLYGVDISKDEEFTLRTDAVFDNTRQGELSKATTTVRDRHLWALIDDQLTKRNSVLVVYGGSHWSTLSVVLEGRLGKPQITPFLN
jgi:hypothetical protein